MDESTGVSVLKQLVLYGHLLVNSQQLYQAFQSSAWSFHTRVGRYWKLQMRLLPKEYITIIAIIVKNFFKLINKSYIIKFFQILC